MSIDDYIYSARYLLSSLLNNSEESAQVASAPYSNQSIRYRKWYWNISKASRSLAALSNPDFLNIQETDMDEYTPKEAVVPQTLVELPPAPTKSVITQIIASNTAKSESPSQTKTYLSVDKRVAAHSTVQNSSLTSNMPGDKLSMAGFAAIKELLLKCQPTNSRRSNRPFISLGELGMEEGWTTIQTNAAFCYNHNPAEGWRREVAIRMSGKSRGSTDIHYVTPDKSRRFRSRQELQSYLNRTSTSVDFINKFDFRSVFCACHRNEDNDRSYLECSYGLAGCNRWIHAECMGLGVRSELELALMPKVICPFCATYLKGTGELASFITNDTYILPEIVWDALDQSDGDSDEIEESDIPHMLWGMQGSAYVYCKETGLSGLNNLSASKALQEQEPHRFIRPGDQKLVNSARSYQNSPHSAQQLQEQQAQRYTVISSPTVQSAATSGPPPLAADASTTPIIPPDLSTFLQHRLFQKWTAVGNSGTGKSASASSSASGGGGGGGLEETKCEREEATVEQENAILSDDDDGVPSNPNELEPVDRVRRARYEDGSTVRVRVDGGWMTRKILRTQHESSPAAAVAATTTTSTSSGENNIAFVDSTADATSSSSSSMPPTGTNAIVHTNTNDANVEVRILGSEQAEKESAESFKQRILDKAALRADALQSSVSSRYKNELIEAAVNIATSSSHRRKHTMATSTISAVVAGNASTTMTENTLSELNASYQLKPALCFLPLEDGGVRFASVSFAQVPRSFHALCATNQLCAVCLTPTDRGDTVHSVVQSDKSKKGSKKRTADVLDPEVDRFYYTNAMCGSITYPVHRQCASALIHPFLAVDDESVHPAIALSTLYEYEQVDDADCDLCGRRGGVMRYFNIDAAASSVTPPAEEGWLGHVPCIQFLHRSGLLRSLPVSNLGSHDSESSGTISQFQRNPLSFRLAPKTTTDDVNTSAGNKVEDVHSQGEVNNDNINADTQVEANNDNINEDANSQGEVNNDNINEDTNSQGEVNNDNINEDTNRQVDANNDNINGDSNRQVEANNDDSNEETNSQGEVNDNCTTSDIAERVDAMDVCTDSEEKDPSNHTTTGASDGQQAVVAICTVAEEGKSDEVQDKDLQIVNQLHPFTPVSMFDQQLGHWRCTLCGLQCGVAARCLAAGCSVRAHPLCAMTLRSPQWRMCKVSTQPLASTLLTANANNVNNTKGGSDNSDYSNKDSSGVSGKTCAGESKESSQSVSVGILCPLHSAGIDP